MNAEHTASKIQSIPTRTKQMHVPIVVERINCNCSKWLGQAARRLEGNGYGAQNIEHQWTSQHSIN